MAKPEIRFGVVAIQKGFVTLEQAVDALEIQVKENTLEGEHRLIGQILLELGFISQSQIDEVLQTLEQKREG
jgi:hypothetical protein